MKSLNGSIVVQGIITKQGRQKLASGVDSFKITKFAIADDQIDYNVITTTNAQNYPILQPVINGKLMMKSKLYTVYSDNQNPVLYSIIIDGLKQDSINLITTNKTITPTTSPSFSENYIFNFDFSKTGNPFSKVEYRTSDGGGLNSITITGNQLTTPAAYQVVLTPRSSGNYIIQMTIQGIETGVLALYKLNIIKGNTTTGDLN